MAGTSPLRATDFAGFARRLELLPQPQKLFLADGATLNVLKSIEVSGSGVPKNNGLVVSFVKFTVSGVDYYTVLYFRKDQANQFKLAERHFVIASQQTESDKSLDAAVADFEKTGKL